MHLTVLRISLVKSCSEVTYKKIMMQETAKKKWYLHGWNFGFFDHGEVYTCGFSRPIGVHLSQRRKRIFIHDLVAEDMKAEFLNAFFASVFTAKAGPHSLEGREKVWRKENSP